jgi:hypothetical protein
MISKTEFQKITDWLDAIKYSLLKLTIEIEELTKRVKNLEKAAE